MILNEKNPVAETTLMNFLLLNDTRPAPDQLTLFIDPARQWEPIMVNILGEQRPAAFKWVFTYTPDRDCLDHLYISLDDITFPTIAPSAETLNLGKAPPAALPSPGSLLGLLSGTWGCISRRAAFEAGCVKCL